MYGYAVLRDDNGTWELTFHQTNGTVRGKTCDLSSGLVKTFTCH